MPCSTLRAWVIGFFWAILVPGLNQFFYFRIPSVQITSVSDTATLIFCACLPSLQVVVQLLSFPIVRLWARIMPNVKIFGLSLNPGPFTIKEHVLITIMGSVGAASAYAVGRFPDQDMPFPSHTLQTDIVAVQRVFYGQTYNFSYQWLLVMSTQLVCGIFSCRLLDLIFPATRSAFLSEALPADSWSTLRL